ncbi:MAG: HAMP domain-containing sensor histidine kinase [Myxococcota bacterium]
MDSLRHQPPPMHGRRGLLIIVGALFVLMAAIACWWVVAQREVVLEQERSQLQDVIDEQVDAWEETLLQNLKQWLEITAAAPELAGARQHALRRHPFFDSLVVWRPPTDDDGPRTVFPLKAAPEAAARIDQSACLRHAERLSLEGVRLQDLAAAYLFGCAHEDDNVRLFAASRAAYWLASAGAYDDALLALDAVGVPDALSLRNAAARKIDPVRLATVRAQRIQLLQRLGRGDEALDLASRTGEQLAELEAPELAAVNVHMREMLSVLEANGRTDDAAKLEGRFERAERRKHAYEEVHRRLVLERVDPDAPPEPRLVSDMYSDQPFLLYYGWSNGVGVALALEQEPLLQNFLRDRMRKFTDGITLISARTDQYVAGARTGGKCAIVVPFDRTLTQLKVCMRQRSVDHIIFAMSDDRWYVTLVIIVACVGFALGALIAVDRAARHEYELLYRQRAFSTRVTHELKTPLAGIRVMAENLELGAYRDEAHRREMAHRIVAEADQLTSRVDEVLSVARQRTIPKPEPFDPEEALLMAVDEWGPRMADAGVQLHAELGATDAVTGDQAAFRDAVACLLDNALKYRREGVDSQVWLDLSQTGRTIAVSVADNGMGVPKAMRKKVFDRFFRVEGPHRGKAGGHGLGLNQVKEIVVAHHGTVACDAGIDGGARFVIRVPATDSAPAPEGRGWRWFRRRWKRPADDGSVS